MFAFLAAGLFGYLVYRSSRKAFKNGGPSNAIYGAWQGHNLGTTDFAPGDLEHLEKDLQSAPKQQD
jgi:hypothetical protein